MVTKQVEPPGTSNRRDKAVKKQQLIQAAIEVFSAHGYDRATTRELAERAGCAEGLIYKHFGGKRELLMAALESKRGSLGPEPVLEPDATLQSELARILRRRVEHIWQTRDFMRVAMSLAAVDGELAQIMESIERSDVKIIADRLRELQARGLIALGTDVEAAACNIDMLMLGLGFFWRVVFSRSQSMVDQQIGDMAGHLARALQP